MPRLSLQFQPGWEFCQNKVDGERTPHESAQSVGRLLAQMTTGISKTTVASEEQPPKEPEIHRAAERILFSGFVSMDGSIQDRDDYHESPTSPVALTLS